MKSTHIFVLALAVVLYGVPAIAQHGHAGSMGGGMGAGESMGHSGTTGHGANANSSPGTAQGKTMDQILTKNTQLAGKIQKLTGMSARDACTGFKNLGQCVAAAHVSKNLGINFACLRADMTGTAAPSGTSCGTSTNTSSKSMSLGQAIQSMNPTVNSKSEAKKATKQAQQDLNGTNS
jgi:hypothetical protein